MDATPFQSTLSVRRATDEGVEDDAGLAISIHALRKESDAQCLVFEDLLAISIHALRKESDVFSVLTAPWVASRFQSTLSVRRATVGARAGDTFHTISIHALRKESDSKKPAQKLSGNVFQSTLSVRRATNCANEHLYYRTFQSTLSIRRATRRSRSGRVPPSDFNPRSP